MSYCNPTNCTYNYCITKGKCFENGRREMRAKFPKPKKYKPNKNSNKPNKSDKAKRRRRLKDVHYEREYWSKIHPRRVVSLIIMRKHDAACVCCYSLDDLTFDHIIPTSKGGSNKLSNGQILCHYCNEIKDDMIISIQELRKLARIK